MSSITGELWSTQYYLLKYNEAQAWRCPWTLENSAECRVLPATSTTAMQLSTSRHATQNPKEMASRVNNVTVEYSGTCLPLWSFSRRDRVTAAHLARQGLLFEGRYAVPAPRMKASYKTRVSDTGYQPPRSSLRHRNELYKTLQADSIRDGFILWPDGSQEHTGGSPLQKAAAGCQFSCFSSRGLPQMLPECVSNSRCRPLLLFPWAVTMT